MIDSRRDREIRHDVTGSPTADIETVVIEAGELTGPTTAMGADREEVTQIVFTECAIGCGVDVETTAQINGLVGNRATRPGHLGCPERAAADIENVGVTAAIS